MTERKVNFSAGPAVLPVEVIEEARDNMLSLKGSGMGIMEISHRSKAFLEIIEGAEADMRELMGLSDDYAVLFLSGGATLQFYQVPWNFLKGGKANYINTGVWSTKAIKAAQKYGAIHVAASSEDKNHTYIPSSYDYENGVVYTHYTSNNTIYGTQFKSTPEGAPGPLVCDASSDILSRPMDIEKHGVIFAGAQKNLGPAGTTIVIVRKDWAESAADDMPHLLSYQNQIEQKSLSNTCPAFPIYVVSLVLKWAKKQGGVAALAKRNEAKAAEIYAVLDSSDFWRAPVEKDSRSLMNPVWRLASDELEAKFLAEAEAAGFMGLKGHRFVGGIRASIYNSMDPANVSTFCDFMKEFEKKNG